MNQEEQFTLFWLAEKTLPIEIKQEISKAFWEDSKEVRRTKIAFLDILKATRKQVGVPEHRIRWWGYRDQYEMRNMVGEIQYGNSYDYYYLTTYHDLKKQKIFCMLGQHPFHKFAF